MTGPKLDFSSISCSFHRSKLQSLKQFKPKAGRYDSQINKNKLHAKESRLNGSANLKGRDLSICSKKYIFIFKS